MFGPWVFFMLGKEGARGQQRFRRWSLYYIAAYFYHPTGFLRIVPTQCVHTLFKRAGIDDFEHDLYVVRHEVFLRNDQIVLLGDNRDK